MRFFLDISYLGTNYHGWQLQRNANTVQAEVEKAFALIFRKHIPIFASGRTDAGVHATQQIVQIDLEEPFTDYLMSRINKLLPPDIAINSFSSVKPEATARFDATSRVYEYRMIKAKSPFLRGIATVLSASDNKVLDIGQMNLAAKILFNHLNFESFSKVHTDVNTFNCTITQAYWEERAEMLVFTIEANRFLRGMVRAVVGTLLNVGRGKISIAEFENIILLQNRSAAASAAPPEGLFLHQVKYPEDIFL